MPLTSILVKEYKSNKKNEKSIKILNLNLSNNIWNDEIKRVIKVWCILEKIKNRV